MRIAVLCLAVFVATTGLGLFAQEGEEDPQERMLQWTLSRLKGSLELSDNQAEEVLKVLRDARKQQDEKVRELLTAEQKERFEGVDSAMRLSSRRGGRSSRMNPMSGPMGLDFETVKRELNLTDEQAGKIEPMVTGFIEKIRTRFEKLREGGFEGFDFRAEMEKVREEGEKLREEVKKHLTEEQQKKVDELFAGGSRGSSFRRSSGSSEGRGNYTDRVMEGLAIKEKAEADAIRSLVDKIGEARNALRDAQRDERNKVREMAEKEGLSDEDAAKFLEEMRAKRTELEKAVREARNELREVISYRQELYLVRMGILE